MNKQYQRVLVTTPHPLLRLVCLGLVTFIFTLFSLELTRFGTLLAPLWFPTSIMMVAFYRHAGKMWPGIALACSFGNIFASWMLFSWASINITYTAINIIEATVGALLLRKLLPGIIRCKTSTTGSGLPSAVPWCRRWWGAFWFIFWCRARSRCVISLSGYFQKPLAHWRWCR